MDRQPSESSIVTSILSGHASVANSANAYLLEHDDAAQLEVSCEIQLMQLPTVAFDQSLCDRYKTTMRNVVLYGRTNGEHCVARN